MCPATEAVEKQLLIIFDLDGTLIDSSEDLAISTNATRHHFGLPPIDAEVIDSYVGNGAAALVRRAMEAEASDEILQNALDFFLKFYRAHALEHTRLYPGVREVLEELSSDAHRLAVLTNKPVRISFDIIGALDLRKHLMRVYGGDSLAQKKPDPIGVRTLISEAGVLPSEALVVGDSGVDVQTARNAGVRSCGVTWGFQPEAFKIYEPDLVIEEPRELLKHVEALQAKLS